MLRKGTFLQDRYEIIEHIGSGGMSDVYKARDIKLNRLVGIKVLKSEFCNDREFVSKFKMEAQAAAGLSHPNVVNVYDVVDKGSLHYIVMELVEGITLKKFIEKKGYLEMMEAVGIAIQVAQGMGAAHDQHIIHRDIKPQNVIISSDGKAKVADFGIARAVSSDTVNAAAMGSVHYISPEQARGEASDERSDIYSLGITIYEMVTGKLPFKGDNSVSIALAHIENDMPLASDINPWISPELDKIILKCCQKKPERRYQNVDELILDLRKLLGVANAQTQDSGSYTDDSTRVLTQQEVGEINARAKVKANSDPKKQKKYADIDDDDEPDGKADKLIMIGGIVLAVIVVAAVVLGILKFSGVIGKSASDISNAFDVVNGEVALLSEKQTYVPDVKGLNIDLATNKLKESNLGIKVERYEFSETEDKDAIISQSPEANEIIDKYTEVTVVVSKGSNGDLSYCLDQYYESLREDLESNYKVNLVEEFSDKEAGTVLNVEPLKVDKGGEITVTVSKGANSDITRVPQLIGLTEEEAIGALADSRLTAGTIDTAVSETVPAGSVVSQSIAADTEISVGTAIGYTLSSGTEPDGKYVAAIRTSFSLTNEVGPGAEGVSAEIMVRLHQEVYNDETGDFESVYQTLMEPRIISGNTVVPIRYDYIEGVYGVEDGQIEVVDVSNDEILESFDLEFFKQQQ